MSRNIRPLRPEDYNSGVIELLSQLTTSVDKSKVTQQQFTNQVAKMSSSGCFTYVFEIDSVVTGIGTIVIEPKLIHNCSNVGHIEDIVVDKKYRSIGVGKWIISYLVNIAKEKECYKVILDCAKSNVEFYKKCGFEDHGIEMRYDVM
jgi:glucosamine-phosphate N-acetyltransferase